MDKFNENHENLQNSFEKQTHTKKIMNYASCVKLRKHDFTAVRIASSGPLFGLCSDYPSVHTLRSPWFFYYLGRGSSVPCRVPEYLKAMSTSSLKVR